MGKLVLTERGQIWFQNRRQNLRRRSRPLSPNESGLYQQTDTPEGTQDSNALESSFQVTPDGVSTRDTVEDSPRAADDNDDVHPPSPTDSITPHASFDEQRFTEPPATLRINLQDQSSQKGFRRSLSGKRLSMNSQGAAKLLDDDESSPSPPRPLPHLRPSFSASDFRRSGSDFAHDGLLSRPARLSDGRSRDSRAWEICCDAEAGNELALKAEQEHMGSAATAIEFLRSHSRTLVGAKAVLVTKEPRRRERPVKPSLERSRTSMARLENSAGPAFHLHEDRVEASHPSLLSSRFCKSPTGDSDKENIRDRRGAPAAAKRRVLGESNASSVKPRPALKPHSTAPTTSSAVNDKASRRNCDKYWNPPVQASEENFDPEEDDEIARFMSSSKGHSSMSLEEEQDMDAIQGLLSLRKGS